MSCKGDLGCVPYMVLYPPLSIEGGTLSSVYNTVSPQQGEWALANSHTEQGRERTPNISCSRYRLVWALMPIRVTCSPFAYSSLSEKTRGCLWSALSCQLGHRESPIGKGIWNSPGGPWKSHSISHAPNNKCQRCCGTRAAESRESWQTIPSPHA